MIAAENMMITESQNIMFSSRAEHGRNFSPSFASCTRAPILRGTALAAGAAGGVATPEVKAHRS